MNTLLFYVISSAARGLSAGVSGLSLAAFRIALGGLLVWDCWRFIVHNRIFRYYVQPEVHFYEGFGWVKPLPDPWIHYAWAAMGLFALLVMLGLLYRVAIVALTVIFTYFFLLDQAEYLNHFYLIILFLILMCFLPAHRVLSLDAFLWRRDQNGNIPYAAVFVLRAQLEIMLIYAGIVKLTPDWLAGEPLGLWLRQHVDSFPFGSLFYYDWIILAGAWGTIALHLIGAPLLLWKKTRLATFVVYCGFHIANAMFFNIGIFPWLAIAATTIFFAPDWPLRVLRWLTRWFGAGRPESEPLQPASVQPLSAVAVIAIVVWLLVQVAVPARAWTTSSDVRWTGDGHRFSWRMRIYDRKAEGRFIVEADGHRWSVDPTDYLTRRQASKMLTRPDMIHQFANYLGARWAEEGYENVAVYADIHKSLNGRPKQRYIDPEVDLTKAGLSLTGPGAWVLPLEAAVWGLADNSPVWYSPPPVEIPPLPDFAANPSR